MFRSLSGRFLALTILFVMLAEIFIFFPSIARFRQDYLNARLERAHLAALVSMAQDDLDAQLEQELLENAGIFKVMLLRDDARVLALSLPIALSISHTYDMRDKRPMVLIFDALMCLLDRDNKVVNVVGNTGLDGGQLIEVALPTGPLRQEMLAYSVRIMGLSAIISGFTALLLYWAVGRLIVRPIKNVVNYMKSYAKSPYDAHHVIVPRSSVKEIFEAEQSLKELQSELTSSLRQQERLAQLGAAMSKISHDLRNILTTVQLFSDRMENSDGPAVKSLAPKLVGTVSRAISLTEATLVYGKAQEPEPRLSYVQLLQIIEDVFESEQLAVKDQNISFLHENCKINLIVDEEQIFRTLQNLVRNSRQILQMQDQVGYIKITGSETEQAWCIVISDNGPGLPARASENLFRPFIGSATRGGTGLGLAIAKELIEGHGGSLDLKSSDCNGTVFEIILPKYTLTD